MNSLFLFILFPNSIFYLFWDNLKLFGNLHWTLTHKVQDIFRVQQMKTKWSFLLSLIGSHIVICLSLFQHSKCWYWHQSKTWQFQIGLQREGQVKKNINKMYDFWSLGENPFIFLKFWNIVEIDWKFRQSNFFYIPLAIYRFTIENLFSSS